MPLQCRLPRDLLCTEGAGEGVVLDRRDNQLHHPSHVICYEWSKIRTYVAQNFGPSFIRGIAPMSRMFEGKASIPVRTLRML